MRHGEEERRALESRLSVQLAKQRDEAARARMQSERALAEIQAEVEAQRALLRVRHEVHHGRDTTCSLKNVV